MPLRKSTSRSAAEENFHEFRHGKTFKKTAQKFGRGKARKQMIAAALSNQRRGKKKKSKRSKGRKASR